MSESGETAPEPKKQRGGLAAMRIADLKAMAGGIGIPGADSMRKAELVEAIRGAGTPKKAASAPAAEPQPDPGPEPSQASAQETAQETAQRAAQQPAQEQPPARSSERDDPQPEKQDKQAGKRQQKQDKQEKAQRQDQKQQDQRQQDQRQQDQKQQDQGQNQQGQGQKQQNQQQNQQQKQQQGQRQQDQQDQQQDDDQGEDGAGSRRSRRRRGRDNREPAAPRQNRRNEPDTQVLEDDVLVPAAGILDVLENYAFVRTSGYLPGTEDVYLSLSLVRKFGLRRGDAVTGQVRQPREGERREKFNPMVRIDGVNSHDPDTARTRPEFDELTAEHPSERIRLETSADDVVGRVLDVAAPIGKGQRCLVRASPRSGRTAFLKSLAASVTASCPEAHLMVVLLHERPEEITDFEREVEGEVIASSFDRAPADHVGVAELALERAKRLVELGHDVVVLVDGLTRLARAFNHAGLGASGGRTLPGGVDAGALMPAKRLFGAARTLAEGGSLTVVATASVDTGAATDELVLEELEGTANAEVRLSRALADAGLHPAVDLAETMTRHEDRLLAPEELAAVQRLRRTLAARPDAASSLGLLLERVAATRSNADLLARATKG